MDPIHENIKNARKKAGLSQKQLAERVGLSDHVSVSRWERGAAHPRGKTLARVAQTLGVAEDWLRSRHGGGKSEEGQPVVSIMAHLALKVCTGIDTPDEREQLLRLVAQHISPVSYVNTVLPSSWNPPSHPGAAIDPGLLEQALLDRAVGY